MKSIPVDVKHLEEVYNIDLHKFEPGKMYPMLELMETLVKFLPRGKTK